MTTSGLRQAMCDAVRPGAVGREILRRFTLDGVYRSDELRETERRFDLWMAREERRMSRQFWPYTYRAVLGVDVSFSGRCTIMEKS